MPRLISSLLCCRQISGVYEEAVHTNSTNNNSSNNMTKSSGPSFKITYVSIVLLACLFASLSLCWYVFVVIVVVSNGVWKHTGVQSTTSSDIWDWIDSSNKTSFRSFMFWFFFFCFNHF